MIRKTPLLLGGLLIALLAIFVGSAVASADSPTPTPAPPKTINYSGSGTNTILNLKLHCDPCVPDIIVSGVGQLAITLLVDTEADLTGAATLSMTLPAGALNQGQGIPVPMTLDSTSGNLTIKGIVGGSVEIQDQVPGGGGQGRRLFGYDLSKSFTLLNKSQTPLHCDAGVCQTSTLTDNLKSPTIIDPCELAGLFIGISLPDPVGDIGAGLKCPITLAFQTTANLTGNGITADRAVEIKAPGAPTIPGTTIDFPKGQFVDLFTIPCDAPVSAFINLALTNKRYGVGINATGKVDLQAQLIAEVDLGPLGSFDIISLLGIDATARININDLLGLPDIQVFGGSAGSGKVIANATGVAKPTFSLGQVSPDKVPPIVHSVTVGTALAGKPVTLTADATDDCKGPTGLHYKWTFSDGGIAFGQTTTHTFAKAGTYSGEVRVTDNAGNEGAKDFSVTVTENRTPSIKFAGPISIVPNHPDPIDMSGTLLDFSGNPIAGRTLQFSITNAAGATVVGPVSSTTDVNGLARVSIPPITLPAGQYQIVVRFKGDATYDPTTFTSKFTVFVNRPPVVAPLPAIAGVVWGKPIEFSGFATDPDGSAQDTLMFLWNFGDSTNGPPCLTSTPTPTTPTATRTATLTPTSTPTPAPTPGPCGNSAINQKVNHTFIKPGTFTVTLTVTDKDGASATVTTTVTVNKRKTAIKQCGDIQVPNGQRTVNDCGTLLDEQGNPVIGKTLVFTMTIAGVPITNTGFTDANGNLRTAFNQNLPAGCDPASINFAATNDNRYLPSSYNYFFYTSGNGGPQNCSFTPAGSAGYDVNCDGSANAVDALYILQVVAGLTSFTSCENVANVNNDGVIDVLDALVLLQYGANPTS